MGMRAAAYYRVSTARQAEKDLSIPDQRRHAHEFCEARGYELVDEYVEPGASALDDKRPQFQRMLDNATSAEHPFDVILVHSLSRFFRDAFQLEFYRRKLERRGVKLVSMTQDFADDPSGEMVRQVVTAFDQYQSKENAKHVLRSMKENARQGFWNGGPPPYGYQSIAVAVRGDATKKRLEINPKEAAIVRQIFDLYLGAEGCPRMGLKLIVEHLNGRGIRYRKGRLFSTGLVQQILANTTYAGRHYFNKQEHRTGRAKPADEWVELATPVIIDPERFEAALAIRIAHRPANTPPRIVNGPTLLTGLAKCADCGGGMTLATGKGGRYRYYRCASRQIEGRTSCPGRGIPMDRLDALVLGEIEKRVFEPARMKEILARLIERSRHRQRTAGTELRDLRRQERETSDKLARLYDALSAGTVPDATGFRRAVSKLESDQDGLVRQIGRHERRATLPKDILSPRNIELFSAAVRKQFQSPDSRLRKAYVRQYVERVEVADGEIRISGPEAALVAGIATMAQGGKDLSGPAAGVPGLMRDWWAQQDSNLRPAD